LFQWSSTTKNPTKRVCLVQSGPHHHIIENYLVLAMIYLKNCWIGINQQSLTLCFNVPLFFLESFPICPIDTHYSDSEPISLCSFSLREYDTVVMAKWFFHENSWFGQFRHALSKYAKKKIPSWLSFRDIYDRISTKFRQISWQNIKKISIGLFFLHANLFMKKPLNNPYSTNK
jgi:hypothetical protein